MHKTIKHTLSSEEIITALNSTYKLGIPTTARLEASHSKCTFYESVEGGLV